MADESVVSPPKKAKKLPFKPTALGKHSLPKRPSADDNDDDDDLALFRRSKEMEPIMAAERERRLQKRQRLGEERRQTSDEGSKRPLDDDEARPHDEPAADVERAAEIQGRSEEPLDSLATGSSSAVNGERVGNVVTPPSSSKRSRIETTPSKGSILNSEEAQPVTAHSPTMRTSRSRSIPPTPIQDWGGTGPGPMPASTGAAAGVITLDSDSDDDLVFMSSPSGHQAGGSVEVVVAASAPAPGSPAPEDDEFEEYVRKAEEQRARDRAMTGADMEGNVQKEAVEIYVTSTVPDTTACRMKFLFGRPLRLVRDTWVAMQRHKGVELPLQQEDDAILTWRRKKVYASSNLLNLGIRPQGDGRLAVDGSARDGLTDGRTRVHMEIWTPELFREMEREEEMRRKREAGELSSDEDVEDAIEEPEPEVKLRVILKARGLDDVKLTVRQETTVETLATGFRTQRGIALNKDVGIWFDGERLKEEVTMLEADIDDMDTLEVHVK
ncbi:hypothetical protein RJ55_05230 [Drechmeria coniospora]|nr:hypothetical protein RJ55_05230 [Drechmeria coniospora]